MLVMQALPSACHPINLGACTCVRAGLVSRLWWSCSCALLQILLCTCVDKRKSGSGRVLGGCKRLPGASVWTGWVLLCFITFTLSVQGHQQLPELLHFRRAFTHVGRHCADSTPLSPQSSFGLALVASLLDIFSFSSGTFSQSVKGNVFLARGLITSPLDILLWPQPSAIRAHFTGEPITPRGRSLCGAVLLLRLRARGGFMGAIALVEALIIARWTSDHWAPPRCSSYWSLAALTPSEVCSPGYWSNHIYLTTLTGLTVIKLI